MKKIFIIIALAILLLPTLLIFNDNFDAFYMNIIGIAWLGIISQVLDKTRFGKKIINELNK